MFENECAMLESVGHGVARFEASNADIPSGAAGKYLMFFATIWNRKIAREIRAAIRREKPDVAHFHNTFPLISPAAYWACKAEGVPVVQTLHNFRLCCLNAYLLRGGAVCELCLGKNPWRGVCKKCYRDSLAQSFAAWAMLSIHRLLGTWRGKVDAYIALTEFGKRKMIEAGLPERKIFVKGNVITAAPSIAAAAPAAPTILYVGRLSPEKGPNILVEAWRLCHERGTLPQGARLVIVGDGPEREALERAAPPAVSFAGNVDKTQVAEMMRAASAIVCPSVWYETFGLVVLEAFSCALPVIASNLGAFASLIKDGKTGILFPPGDAAALADALTLAFAEPELMREIAAAARRAFLVGESTPERNLTRLLEIYNKAAATGKNAQ